MSINQLTDSILNDIVHQAPGLMVLYATGEQRQHLQAADVPADRGGMEIGQWYVYGYRHSHRPHVLPWAFHVLACIPMMRATNIFSIHTPTMFLLTVQIISYSIIAPASNAFLLSS